jgi:hypothetical protein
MGLAPNIRMCIQHFPIAVRCLSQFFHSLYEIRDLLFGFGSRRVTERSSRFKRTQFTCSRCIAAHKIHFVPRTSPSIPMSNHSALAPHRSPHWVHRLGADRALPLRLLVVILRHHESTTPRDRENRSLTHLISSTRRHAGRATDCSQAVLHGNRFAGRHCLSEDSEAVARPTTIKTSRATRPYTGGAMRLGGWPYPL